MKRIFLVCTLWFAFLCASAMPGKAVPEKVLQVFALDFPNAKDVQWNNAAAYDEVYFKLEEMTYRLRYDEAGNMIWARRYYTGHRLNPFLKGKLSREFPGKSTYGVTETTDTDGVTYHIVLEDSKGYSNVFVDALGYVSVESIYRKAEPESRRSKGR